MDGFKNISEGRRFQTESVLINLVRGLRGISNKGAIPTYYSTIKLARQILPKTFNKDSLIAQRHHEPGMVRSYRQQAEVKSQIIGREVAPLEIVDDKMSELNQLISTNIQDKGLLKKELEKLRIVRPLLVPRNLKEDYILAHDVKSMRFGVNPLQIDAKPTDYQVAENRVIRVRLIHPNDGEQSIWQI